MRIFKHHADVVGIDRAAVAIGNFDGFHVGHQALVQRAKALARKKNAKSIVLTFDPHPAKVLAVRLTPPLLTSLEDKLRLLATTGVDAVVVQPFDADFAAWSPESFVNRVLQDALHAVGVVVGYDFTFGAARSGTTVSLSEMGRTAGFDVEVVPAQAVGQGLVASSTKVRAFVLEGRMQAAALVLGRPHHISGKVVEGARRGRTIGFPTANLESGNEVIPKNGVYAGWLDWGEGAEPAVVNVGYKPTFGEEQLSIEAHVIVPTHAKAAPPELMLYGLECDLYFAARLREERRFESVEALTRQIALDRERARALLAQVTTSGRKIEHSEDDPARPPEIIATQSPPRLGSRDDLEGDWKKRLKSDNGGAD